MANGTLKVSNIQTSSGSGTITLGQSGETVTIASGATQTGVGITQHDYWRATDNNTFSSVNTWTHLATGFAQYSPNGVGKIGSGLTESSGTFSFPSTGFYRIDVEAIYYSNSSASSYNYISIYATTDNSTYASTGSTATGLYSAQNVRSTATKSVVLDVTDTSQVKFKLYGFVYNTDAYVDYIQIQSTKIGDT